MFGIGLPEMILILALALIVVGPDKLPDLARSLAKGIMELKKTAEGLKQSFSEEGNPLDEIKPDLEEAAKSLKQNLLDSSAYKRDEITPTGVNPSADHAANAYRELLKRTADTPKLGTASVDSAPPTPDQEAEETIFTPVDNESETEPAKRQDEQ
jgi:sec-independent protein translocase protein TatB